MRHSLPIGTTPRVPLGPVRLRVFSSRKAPAQRGGRSLGFGKRCRFSQLRRFTRMVAAAGEEVAQEDFDAMLSLASTLQRCPEKPSYHVMCKTGWLNDPNGPIYHGGKYHLFYQHIIDGCEWDFGIVWGHAISDDLVHWQHLPPALLPTPGGADADGCFSGCCIPDSDGTPVILYTGVRLRSNPECGELPPSSQDLNLPFVECQLSAKPVAGDPQLATWVKGEQPLIELPPPDMGLVGWRDPFIFEVGDEATGQEWGMLMGSGLKGKGGSVMIYRAATLLGEWRYSGMLCVAETTDTGAMWECPLLLELQLIPDELRPAGLGAKGHTHLRSRSESYRSTVASDSDWSSESDSDDEQTARQPNGVPNGTAAVPPLPAEQPQQAPTAETFEQADDDSNAAALAGHPENGQAGDTVAEGVGPGMGGATLDEAAAEQARASVDGMAGAPTSSREADGSGQRSDANGAANSNNGRGRRGNGVSQLPVSQLSSKLNGLALEAEPPPPRFTHLLCVSPDAPTNPVLYWLGLFDAKATEFLLAGAKGPIRLDLGDVLYAPNLQTDAFGRDIMWGWLQERRKAGTYDYSGCMTVPRLLYIEDERLIQIPVPEIKRLRTGKTWTVRDLEVPSDQAVPLPGEMGSALDMTLILRRGSADAAGLLFRSWNAGGEGSAAILFDFTRNILEAVFEGAGTDLATSQELYPDDDTVRRVGGPTELAQGEDCHLRILVDHSCIEVFAGSGEVLSTRIYRGSPPPDADSGISFVAFGGSARVSAADAWEMGTIWRDEIPTAVEPASIYEPVSQRVAPKPPPTVPGMAIPVA